MGNESIVAVVIFKNKSGPTPMGTKYFETNEEALEFYETFAPMDAILVEGHALGVRQYLVVERPSKSAILDGFSGS
jgi:hypothetical protein